jgi:acetyl-CoA carboxylase, biotin carboxylase subunit
VRWDAGIQEGDEVSLFYDPMLAKLIVHAPTRELAIKRMLRALAELRIVGVETSVPFHRRVLAEADFRAGRIDIRYIDQHPGLLERATPVGTLRAAAVVAALLAEEERQRRAIQRIAPAASTPSRWRDTGWR